MIYRKPELTFLAPAISVIRTQCSQKGINNLDSLGCSGSNHNSVAAYEADE